MYLRLPSWPIVSKAHFKQCLLLICLIRSVFLCATAVPKLSWWLSWVSSVPVFPLMNLLHPSSKCMNSQFHFLLRLPDCALSYLFSPTLHLWTPESQSIWWFSSHASTWGAVLLTLDDTPPRSRASNYETWDAHFWTVQRIQSQQTDAQLIRAKLCSNHLNINIIRYNIHSCIQYWRKHAKQRSSAKPPFETYKPATFERRTASCDFR